MVGDGTWVGAPVCFPGAGYGIRYPNGTRTPEQWPAAHRNPRRLPSHREEKRRGETLTGGSGIVSTVKSDGQACCQVNWCCNCAWHSTFSNYRPVQPNLQIPEHPASVHGLSVLAQAQKLRRLPAMDAGGGYVQELSCDVARTAREPLVLPSAVNGAYIYYIYIYIYI